MSPRERIAGARLYLVCDARPREFLAAAIRGGVDVVQLRDKALGDEALVTAAREFRAAADAGGALFVLNDRPDLVAACAADGVHVGQDDGSPAEARAAVGADAIVGRSTHAPGPVRRRGRGPRGGLPRRRAGARDADQARPARRRPGLRLLRGGARGQAVVRDRRAGRRQRGRGDRARRDPVVVVRAITESDDPESAAAALRAALEGRRGQAQP